VSGRTFLLTLAALAALSGRPAEAQGAAAPARLDAERFRAHVRALTATPHRLSGTPEAARAAAYIERQLRGLKGEFHAQPFPIPTEVLDRCDIRLGGTTLPLLPLAANGMQPSVTDRTGLRAPLIYAGTLRFAVSDVLDWTKFLAALRAGGAAEAPSPARRLWRSLGPETQRALAELRAGDDPPAALKAAVAGAVNRALDREDLYTPEAWAQVTLRAATRRLLRRRPFALRPHERCRLNRYLFEDAFPALLSRGFDGKHVRGSIAVLDFSGTEMLDAFRLGAAAVIFVQGPRDDPEAAPKLRSRISIDLPRFYVSEAEAEPAGLLTAAEGTLTSQVHWEPRQGRNLFFVVPGTRPVFKFKKEEVVLLSAYYDTRGVVPYRCRDAEAAANCAALLEIARQVSESPLRRTVMVAFFDGHQNYLEGGRRFYTALRKSIPERIDDTLWDRRKYVDEERTFLKKFLAIFEAVDLLAAEHDTERLLDRGLEEDEIPRLITRARERLRDKAKFEYNEVQERLTSARLRVGRIRKRIGETEAAIAAREKALADLEAATGPGDAAERRQAIEEHRAAIARARAGIAEDKRLIGTLREAVEALLPRQKGWQIVRECVRDTLNMGSKSLEEQIEKYRRRAEGLPERDEKEVRQKRAKIRLVEAAARQAAADYAKAIQDMKATVQRRLKELDALGARLDATIAALKPLADANPVSHVSFRFTSGTDRWHFIPYDAQEHLKLFAGLLDEFTPAGGGSGGTPSGLTLDDLHYVKKSRQTWEAQAAAPTSYINWISQEESTLAGQFKIPAMTLVTEQDRAPFVGKPDVDLPPERVDRIRAQAECFLPMLRVLGTADWVSVRNQITAIRDPLIDEYVWQGDRTDGHLVKAFSYGDAEASKIETNCLIHFIDTNYQQDFYLFADGNGHFPFITIVRRISGAENWFNARIEAARFDEDNRIKAITVALPAGPVGSVQAGWAKAAYYRAKAVSGHYAILNMFRSREFSPLKAGISRPQHRDGRLVGLRLPFGQNFIPSAFKVFEGLSDGTFKRLHFRFEQAMGLGVYHVDDPLGIKFIYKHPKNSDDVAFFINATEQRDLGIGFGPGNGVFRGTDPVTVDLKRQAAPDLFRLNESRLDRLRSKNIVLNTMEYIHSRAKFTLERYRRALAERRYREADTLADTVTSFERRVYRPVMDTTDDMVSAVTVLLLLAIPPRTTSTRRSPASASSSRSVSSCSTTRTRRSSSPRRRW